MYTSVTIEFLRTIHLINISATFASISASTQPQAAEEAVVVEILESFLSTSAKALRSARPSAGRCGLFVCVYFGAGCYCLRMRELARFLNFSFIFS